MANLDITPKNPGDQHTSAEFNSQVDWANAPGKALGTFTGAMDFSSQGQYTDFTMSGPIELTATNIALFNVQVVRITTDGINDITFGTGIDKVITPFTNPLPAGAYWFYMASFVSPGGSGNGIHVSIPEVQAVLPAVPLDALILSSPIVSDGQAVINFTNPNGGNEDLNQLEYKLSTEPTIWTTGATAATGLTQFTQTGLTNGLEYNFRAIANGSGGFSDSAYSNIVNGTPTTGTPLAAPTLTSLIPNAGAAAISFTNPNGGNEDQNQIYYKLSTEPTTWTAGIVIASSGTNGTQTGLTNDLSYDIKIVAEGSGGFSDSPDSNTLSVIPTAAQALSITIDPSYANVLNPAGLSVGNGTTDSPFSVSLNIEPTSLAELMRPIYWGEDTGTPLPDPATALTQYMMQVRTDGSFRLLLHNFGPQQLSNMIYADTSAGALAVNTPAKVVVTYSGNQSETGINMYVNGSLDTIQRAEFGTYNAMPAANANYRYTLGKALWDSGIQEQQFSGNMDNVAVWNKELNLSEVQELWNSGNAFDVTTHSAYAANCVSLWQFQGDYTDTKGSNDMTPLSTNIINKRLF